MRDDEGRSAYLAGLRGGGGDVMMDADILTLNFWQLFSTE